MEKQKKSPFFRPADKDQIVEIMRQIGTGEIDFDAAQAVIEHRLMPTNEAVRVDQAKCLYELGFGSALGYNTFGAYLKTIPPITYSVWGGPCLRFFGAGNVWLVDGRVAEKVGLEEYCRLAGLRLHCRPDNFEPVDPNRAPTGIRWMLGQDGYRNTGRSAVEWRATAKSFEIGMDVIEGVAVYALGPRVITCHKLILPGSTVLESPELYAPFLGATSVGPSLFQSWYDAHDGDCGVASRAI